MRKCNYGIYRQQQKSYIYTDLYIMIECQPIKVDGATLKKYIYIYIYIYKK